MATTRKRPTPGARERVPSSTTFGELLGKEVDEASQPHDNIVTARQERDELDELNDLAQAVAESTNIGTVGLSDNFLVTGPGILGDIGITPDSRATGGSGSPLPNLPAPSFPQIVQLAPTRVPSTPDQDLWTLIRSRTEAITTNNVINFLDDIVDAGKALLRVPESTRRMSDPLGYLGSAAYDVIRSSTEYFLMQEVGLVVDPDPYRPEPSDKHPQRDALQQIYETELGIAPGSDPTRNSEYRRRNFETLSDTWLTDLRSAYGQQLANSSVPVINPYMQTILDRLRDLPLKLPGEVPGTGYGVVPARVTGPLAIELIWNYWHEEGMVMQCFNAITNRFQNVRTSRDGDDVLRGVNLAPIRHGAPFLWGWIQNGYRQLTVARRAYEYQNQYGLPLVGSAVGEIDAADSRTQFLAAFHNLLHLATIFYQQDDDLTVQADGYPILNALRDTQLVLSAGAHNQYGDLPWTARVETLMQTWFLARPEMREYFGGRPMVPYKEPWMDRVDALRTTLNLGDVNVTHFRDLAHFGEQVLLSIRFGNWAHVIEPESAKNWARYWRPEVLGYIHAYRAVTGVDLRQRVDNTSPALLLRQRLAEMTGNRRALAATMGGPASMRLRPGAQRALSRARSGPRA